MKLLKPETISLLLIDNFLLVVNKPANLSVIHDRFRPDEISLVDQLKADYGPLWVVHRLDRETSGVIIFARTKGVHRFLNELFQARHIQKTYHLLACGDFSWREIEVDLPLEVNGDRQHRTVAKLTSGKPAKTDFSILQEFGHDLFLIQANPKSGYTHQIRAHISALNGMILNDPLYKPHPPQQPPISPYNPGTTTDWVKTHLPIFRLALHAASISFIHPDNHELVTLSAPYPDDFNNSIQILKTTGQLG